MAAPAAVSDMKNLQGRKAKMLIVYPDYTDRDLSQKGTGGNYMEGLASISAVLKQAGALAAPAHPPHGRDL